MPTSKLNWSELSILRREDVEGVHRLSGGGNNRVFLLEMRSGERQVLKYYFSHPSDKRDRLGAEFSAFQFLHEQGLRCTPQSLQSQRDPDCATFSYIEGNSGVPALITKEDLDQVTRFVKDLSSLSEAAESPNFAEASEACFSLQRLLENINERLGILERVPAHHNPLSGQLTSFLRNELKPVLNQCTGQLHGDLKAELALRYRVLSPSDLGFHNAIQTEQGDWIFQDFEYFGWDDPVKLVSDFALHPAMQLSTESQEYWFSNTRSLFARDPGFEQRLADLYPLYALKWCCILLNEFVPEYRQRRGFASLEEAKLEETQSQQLSKAKKMLARACSPR